MSDSKSGKDQVITQAMKAAGAILPASGEPLGFAGGLIMQLLSEVIPSRWRRNIERQIRILDVTLEGVSDEVLLQKAKAETFQVLLEDAIRQSARSNSDQRRHDIANLLRNVITEEDARGIEARDLLKLLGELTDREVLVLKYILMSCEGDDVGGFLEKNDALLAAEPVRYRDLSGEERADYYGRVHAREQATRRLLSHGLIALPAGAETARRNAMQIAALFDSRVNSTRAWTLKDFVPTPVGEQLLRMIESDDSSE